MSPQEANSNLSAFRYLQGEMTGDELALFEGRLESDLELCEILSSSVPLVASLKRISRERPLVSVQASFSRWRMLSGLCASVASLFLLAIWSADEPLPTPSEIQLADAWSVPSLIALTETEFSPMDEQYIAEELAPNGDEIPDWVYSALSQEGP